MELHERQQFEFFLAGAVDNYVERLMHRCGGAGPAHTALSSDPEGDQVWLGEYVAALFSDFLLDNAAGHAFILMALERRPVHVDVRGTVSEALAVMARTAFGEVLTVKTLEALDRESSMEAGA